MRTTNLLKTAVAGFTLLLGCFLFTKCNTSSATSDMPGKENTVSVLNTIDKVCKMIKAQEIKGAIAKSKNKKIILNIYPVKLSNNPAKKDFDLKIFFQDAAGNYKNIGAKINYKLFETQSGWYVSFLKDKNVLQNKIPFGYFLEADSAFIQSKIGVSFCLVPGEENMEYFLLAAKPDSKDGQKIAAKDSTCKCPPDCCKYLLIKSDSTGKCPPDCLGIPLLLEPIVKIVIAKNY